jgi:hypothetical protein
MKDNLSSQFAGEQLSLFNSDEYQTPDKRPGQKSFDEWLETEKPIYHGSGRSDFGNAPMAHYGTRGQAADRVSVLPLGGDGNPFDAHSFRRAKYLGEASSEDDYYDNIPKGKSSTSRSTLPSRRDAANVYARRLTEKKAPGVFTDQQANAAEYGARIESGEYEDDIPKSIVDSAGQMAPRDTYDSLEWPERSAKAQVGSRALDRGTPIEYHNKIEGDNREDTEDTRGYRKSIIAPSSSVTSWERDVLKDPGSTDMAKDHAQKRIDNGNEGKVPFRSAVPTKGRPTQESLPLTTPTGEQTHQSSKPIGPLHRTITDQRYNYLGIAQG